MILDVIILVLFFLAIIIGYKKGLMKIILKFVGFILALTLAYIFCNSLANYIYNDTSIGEKLSISIEEKINGHINNSKEKIDIDGYYQSIESLLSSDEKQVLDVENSTMVTEVSNKIAMYIIKGASFILIVLIVNICIFILSLIFEGIFNLPILKTFNKTGGCIASFILTMFRIWIILGILSILSPIGGVNQIIQQINSSIITKWLYNNNILMSVILKSVQK